MIPQQLDLFGMSPKPPKKILSDEFSDAKQKGANSTSDTVKADTPAEILPVETVETPAPIQIDTQIIVPKIEDIPKENFSPALVVETGKDDLNPEEFEEEEAELPDISQDENVDVQSTSANAEPGDIASEIPSGSARKMPVNFGEEMSRLNIPPDEELYKRQYYSMRETAAMFDLPQPLLRHWEIEFDIVAPKKNKKGDRHFRPVDIKNLQLIYHLLKVKKFTLDGARTYLQSRNQALDTFELTQRLEKLKLFLYELKAHL